MECNCCRFFDRTRSPTEPEKNVTVGFKNTLDFFESVTAKYIANELCIIPEINIFSLGSGKLLRELIIIAKLIKELEKINLKFKKIVLHAVDTAYKKPSYINDVNWKKSTYYLCQEPI
ncbi:MAG: hypothetical protein H0T84_13620 [Tatlockia sp.]|nr:hypothetical protein [Tatlockia sp.]